MSATNRSLCKRLNTFFAAIHRYLKEPLSKEHLEHLVQVGKEEARLGISAPSATHWVRRYAFLIREKVLNGLGVESMPCSPSGLSRRSLNLCKRRHKQLRASLASAPILSPKARNLVLARVEREFLGTGGLAEIAPGKLADDDDPTAELFTATHALVEGCHDATVAAHPVP